MSFQIGDDLLRILQTQQLYNDLYKILNDNELDVDALINLKNNEIDPFCRELKLNKKQTIKFKKLMGIITNKNHQMQIMIIGDVGVGKTSLLQRYVMDTFNDDIMTKTEILSDESVANINIWDGSKCMIKQNDYVKGDCIIICYEIGNHKSEANVAKWADKIEKYGNDNVIVFSVGCKSDLSTLDRAETEEKQSDSNKKNQWKFKLKCCDCSAKTGDNVNNIFSTAAECVFKKKKTISNQQNKPLNLFNNENDVQQMENKNEKISTLQLKKLKDRYVKKINSLNNTIVKNKQKIDELTKNNLISIENEKKNELLISQQKERINKFITELTEQKKDNKALSNKIIELTKQNNELNDNLNKLNKKKDSIEIQLEKEMKLNKELKNKSEELLNHKSELQSKYDSSISANNSLNAKLSRTTNRIIVISKSNQKLKKKMQKTKLEAKVQTITKLKDEFRNKYNELQSKYEDVISVNNNMSKEMQRFKKVIEENKNEIKEYARQTTNNNKEITALRTLEDKYMKQINLLSNDIKILIYDDLTKNHLITTQNEKDNKLLIRQQEDRINKFITELKVLKEQKKELKNIKESQEQLYQLHDNNSIHSSTQTTDNAAVQTKQSNEKSIRLCDLYNHDTEKKQTAHAIIEPTELNDSQNLQNSTTNSITNDSNTIAINTSTKREIKKHNEYTYNDNGFKVFTGYKNKCKPIYSITLLYCTEKCNNNKNDLRDYLIKSGKFKNEMIKQIIFKQRYSLIKVKGALTDIKQNMCTLNKAKRGGSYFNKANANIISLFKKHKVKSMTQSIKHKVKSMKNKLYVNNFDILKMDTHKRFTNLFLKYGDLVTDIKMGIGRNSEPYAIVHFTELDDAKKCFESELTFDGKILNIQFYKF